MVANKKRGFTIVELLIVIVVIGILAAVIIVAYSGIQKRAQGAAAQSSALQVAKKAREYSIDNNGSYPTTLATIGFTNNDTATYQYTYDNGASPKSFCITVTVGQTAYYVGQEGVPALGVCTGHTEPAGTVTPPQTFTTLTWTNRTSSGTSTAWSNIDISEDGRYLVATPQVGYLMTSNDFGVTWVTHTETYSGNWSFAKMSSDGKIVIGKGSGTNIPYISRDYGATFTSLNVASRTYGSVSISDDYAHIVLTESGSYYGIQVSHDSGTSWTRLTNPTVPGANILTGDSSISGAKVMVGNHDASTYMYVSDDYGDTWVARGPAKSWSSIAVCGVGTIAYAVQGSSGLLYKSNDGGVTWGTKGFTAIWRSIACSSDGLKLVAATSSGLYTSIDGGDNWVLQTAVDGVKYVVASSRSGVKVASVGSTTIWTGSY